MNSSQEEKTNSRDGHFSMIEFAIIYFRQSLNKLAMNGATKMTVPGDFVLQRIKESRIRGDNNSGKAAKNTALICIHCIIIFDRLDMARVCRHG